MAWQELVAILTIALSSVTFIYGVILLITWQSENTRATLGVRTAAGTVARGLNLPKKLGGLVVKWLGKSKWFQSLETQLLQADLTVSPVDYVIAIIGLALVLAIAIGIVFSLNMILNLGIGSLLAFILANFFLESRRDRYLDLLAAQIPDAALLISNSLKAGTSVVQALEKIPEKMGRPASIEFKRLVREIELGRPADEAMEQMIERFPCEELSLLLRTIIIQRRAGGNLARALTVASTAIVMRHRVRNEISTVTAEARFTSIVILLIPIFTLALLNQLLPGSVTEFLSGIGGLIFFGVFIGIFTVSFFLIARISRVRV